MAGKKKNKVVLTLEEKQRAFKKIGKRLKDVRKEAGYSAILDFAYEIDMQPSQYGRYEIGADMQISTLLRILKAHGMTIQEFFAGIE